MPEETLSSSKTAAPATAGAGHEHRYLIFALVSLALLMSSVDLTIVSTALPTIGRDLGNVGINWTSWIITVYSLGRVVITPMVGRISELLGTRRIFLVALSVFTTSSLLCGLAPNLPLLIALRGIQAVGGAAFVPSATGLVAAAFDKNRDRAVSFFSSIVPIGGIIGPVLGGVLVSYWSWRGVFLINVPFGIAILAVAARYLPDVAARSSGRFDVADSILLCVGLLSATLAITYLGDAGHSADVVVVGLAVIAAITLGMLLRRSDRPGAIIPRRLLRGRGFGVMNVINLFYGAAAVGFSALVPVYAQTRYGMSSLESGTLLTARGIGVIAVSGAAVFALRRTGYRLPMVVGYLLGAAGMVLLATRAPGWVSPHTWLSVSALVVGIGVGISLPAANNASMQLDPSQIAAIAGLRVTLRQFGSIAAVSVTTALMSRSADPGNTEATVFVCFAVLLGGVVAIVPLVPEHRDAW